ncbi:MAG: SHOCT domain-containing protein [Oscillospiraceae bacterium]|nr:SHOCT domain-containing protein [Oscillospiraceae bacterium]
MVLMILGALLVAGGFASVIYGNFMNNDFSSQLAHYSSGGDPGNIWMIIGVIAILVGIVMIICGPSQMKAEKRFEKEIGGARISSYQRNLLKVYLSQLDNGVITKEEYQAKKEKLLNEE